MKNQIKFINASHLLEENNPSFSFGVTIFDIDGDDEPEILVANSKSENYIYKYCDHEKKFLNISPSNFKLTNDHTICFCVADFLGSGIPAIYTLNSDTFAGLKNRYDNLFSRTSSSGAQLELIDLFLSTPQMTNPYSGRSVAAVDFSGSGKYGFYVVNYDAPTLFYQYNSEKNIIEEKAKYFGIRQVSFGRSVLAQSILNEGCTDIFVGNDSEANSFFTKSDLVSYQDEAARYHLQNAFSDARGVAIADFNGNGFSDIILANWYGQNSIYMQNKVGFFEDMSPALFTEPMSVRNIIVADFDNDGYEEIFINNFEHSNKMLRYLGHNEWEELNIGELTCEGASCTGVSVGDLTGNGFLDIFVSTGEVRKQKNFLFLGIPNNNFWLRIQPLTPNGFPALGAKVRIFCRNQRNQTKFICSGSGYLCQMEPVAHFGFGSSFPDIERIDIIWPSSDLTKIVQTSIEGNKVFPNSFFKIPHPNTK
jgi:hypothetical protein